MKLISVYLLTILLTISACSDRFSPTTPTTNEYSGSNSPPENDLILSNWSPYLLIHPTSGAINAYKESFAELSKRGKLKGIRLNIDNKEVAKQVTTIAQHNNLDILGLISTNSTLNPAINPNIEATIAEMYQYFPEINTFQIGNEVTIGPSVNPIPISLERYMETWKKVWTFTRKNYPNKILVTQSTHSAADLEKMIDMGLLKVEGANINNLIISMNCYTPDVAGFYGDVIRSRANGFRTWVTESGYNDWNMHKYQIEHVYPIIRTEIRPERIFWYALFAGETDGDSNFGLIKQINVFPLRGSPLYEYLMDRGGGK